MHPKYPEMKEHFIKLGSMVITVGYAILHKAFLPHLQPELHSLLALPLSLFSDVLYWSSDGLDPDLHHDTRYS